MLPPAPRHDEPQIVTAPGEMPKLAGPSVSVRNSLGLGTAQGPAARSGTAAAHIPGDAIAH